MIKKKQTKSYVESMDTLFTERMQRELTKKVPVPFYIISKDGEEEKISEYMSEQKIESFRRWGLNVSIMERIAFRVVDEIDDVPIQTHVYHWKDGKPTEINIKVSALEEVVLFDYKKRVCSVLESLGGKPYGECKWECTNTFGRKVII